MYDIDLIAALLTEDPDVLNEFVIQQYQEFWDALGKIPVFQEVARTQDIDALMQMLKYPSGTGPKARDVMHFALSNGWHLVADNLRKRLGLTEPVPWVAAQRAGKQW